DADGVSDVLTSGQEADERWTVRLQRGVRGSGLGAPVIVAENVGLTLRFERSLAAGDLDGDGKLDFVVPDASKRNLLLFRGAGNGSFAPPRAIPIEGPAYPSVDSSRIAIADVTGDSRADLVVNGESFLETSILIQQSDGTFVERFRLPAGNSDVAARDVNGDGAADVIVSDGTRDGSEVVVYFATCAESLRAVPPAVRLLAPATVPEKKTVELSVVLDAPDAAGTVWLVEGHYHDDSSRVLATATVSGGRAHFFTSTLSRGTHRLKAVYSGDGRLARAVSPVIDVAVTEAPPTGPRRRSVRR
ncbi:MAG TPA: FG-GAP-like repeat-containing protein, partial [Thermoanaerobaculia bacterium]|nr:FG-GAP-like repeat-containing protein [Thermoanaerobaculia bacterium]